jgi:biopolymer transport protein TolR
VSQDPRHAIASAPNVTPLVDVMLVLLIIFMVVTPTLVSGVHAEPPEAVHLTAHPIEAGDHTLAMGANGSMLLDKRPITLDLLGGALTALYPAGAPNRVLYIRAHRELPYGDISEAIDVARRSGVAVVGMVSEQKRVPVGSTVPRLLPPGR